MLSDWGQVADTRVYRERPLSCIIAIQMIMANNNPCRYVRYPDEQGCSLRADDHVGRRHHSTFVGNFLRRRCVLLL